LTFQYVPLAYWSQRKRDRTHWRDAAPETPQLATLVLNVLKAAIFAKTAQVARLLIEKRVGAEAKTTISVQALA
jgi:hypothetical protein